MKIGIHLQRVTCFFVALAFCLIMPCIFSRTAFADGTNRYVVKSNPGAAIPYDTPAKAAADIQTAINYCNAGDTVLVAAATYDTGGNQDSITGIAVIYGGLDDQPGRDHQGHFAAKLEQ